jgi:hypothetical protein
MDLKYWLKDLQSTLMDLHTPTGEKLGQRDRLTTPTEMRM